MALVLADRVQVATSTTGTGTLTLGAALDGFQDFSVIGDGNTTYYTIISGNNWEVGIGTYTASGTTLSRDTILDSSNGGSAINLAGISNVFVTYPADKSVNSDDIGVTVQAYDADTTKNDVVNTFSTNQIIDVSTTDPAVRITQTGTGNAFVVEDSANPDSTPFVINADGRVINGYTTTISIGSIIPNLQNIGSGISASSMALASFTSDGGPRADLFFTKSNTNTIGDFSQVGSGTSLGQLRFFGADNTKFIEGAKIQSSVDATPGTDDMPGRLMFFTTPSGSATPVERMRITSGGNVLMQTTTTTSTSNVGASFEPTSNSRAILYLGTSSTGTNTLTSFRNPNGEVGSIKVNGSATSYNTSSDYRLKEDVSPMTGALDKVALLKPITYKWKVDGSNGQGFIAHELQEVVPECVSGEKDGVDAEGNPEYQGVDTSFLVATLTAAIQELNAKVEALEAQLNKVQ